MPNEVAWALSVPVLLVPISAHDEQLVDDLGMILTTLNAFPSCVVSLISNPSNSVCNARKRISYVMC